MVRLKISRMDECDVENDFRFSSRFTSSAYERKTKSWNPK